MNIMPGFTAETSLYKSAQTYVGVARGATTIGIVSLAQLSDLRVHEPRIYDRVCAARCFTDYLRCTSAPHPCYLQCSDRCESYCFNPNASEAERWSCEQICQAECEDNCRRTQTASCRAIFDACNSRCYIDLRVILVRPVAGAGGIVT
jgi:hypothetical protein